MDYFPPILSAGDAYAEVVNAFSPQMGKVYVAVQVSSEELEASATALFEIELGDGVTWKVLHEFDSGTLAYLWEDDTTHYLLASGGYLHELKNGALTVHGFVSDSYLDGIAQVAPGKIAVFGERGEFYLFENGAYRKIESETEETLFSADFISATSGYVGGNYGTLLEWDGDTLQARDIGSHAFIRAVKITNDGAVLLACTDGEAFELREDQVKELPGGEADFYSIAEFRGAQFWGDDGYGILQRSNGELIEQFKTEYAFQINISETAMIVNAGYWVYLFDGKDWTGIQLNENLETLFEIAPIDF